MKRKIYSAKGTASKICEDQIRQCVATVSTDMSNYFDQMYADNYQAWPGKSVQALDNLVDNYQGYDLPGYGVDHLPTMEEASDKLDAALMTYAQALVRSFIESE